MSLEAAPQNVETYLHSARVASEHRFWRTLDQGLRSSTRTQIVSAAHTSNGAQPGVCVWGGGGDMGVIECKVKVKQATGHFQAGRLFCMCFCAIESYKICSA
jgi:hypothetical protein